MPCRVEHNVDRILALLARGRRERDVLHAGLDRRALSRADPPHRRTPGTNSRATATRISGRPSRRARSFSRTSASPRRCSRTSPGSRCRAIVRRAFRSDRRIPGPSSASPTRAIATARASIRSGTTTTASPTAPRFAHEVQAGLLEVPVTTVRMFNANWPAGGGGYFRLLPYRVSRWSIRRVNAVDRQPAMFYFHPWELDPGAAARHGVAGEGAVSPLRQPQADGTPAATPARRFPLGSRRPGVSQRRRCRPEANRDDRSELAPDDGRRASVRAADAQRWEAFVDRCPDATFLPSHRLARDHRGGLPPSHALPASPSAAASIVGVLPLAEVKSRLFGHALVSLPFCVYGGPAADDADGRALR